jgi:hypothetical protein
MSPTPHPENIPRDVACLINTHLHFDHCGGNRLFPGVPIHVQARELADARSLDDWAGPQKPAREFLGPTPSRARGNRGMSGVSARGAARRSQPRRLAAPTAAPTSRRSPPTAELALPAASRSTRGPASASIAGRWSTPPIQYLEVRCGRRRSRRRGRRGRPRSAMSTSPNFCAPRRSEASGPPEQDSSIPAAATSGCGPCGDLFTMTSVPGGIRIQPKETMLYVTLYAHLCAPPATQSPRPTSPAVRGRAPRARRREPLRLARRNRGIRTAVHTSSVAARAGGSGVTRSQAPRRGRR